MLCVTTLELLVSNDRIADELGGVCGAPSALASNSAPAVAATTTTATETATTDAAATTDATTTDAAAADTTTTDAAATTRRLQDAAAAADTTTTETTETAVVEPTTVTSTVNMYVLPDPYATAYDSAAVVTAATAGALDTALAAVEGVSAFGTMAAVTGADMAAETANAFSDAGVSGVGSSTAVTLSGSTTAAGYVMCYMDKTGTLTTPVETATTARVL